MDGGNSLNMAKPFSLANDHTIFIRIQQQKTSEGDTSTTSTWISSISIYIHVGSWVNNHQEAMSI